MTLHTSFFRYMIGRTKYYVHQQARNLPRWSHRRPVQVIAPEEYDEIADKKNPAISKMLEEPFQEKVISDVKIKWKQPILNISKKKDVTKEQPLQFGIKSSVKPLTIRKVNVHKEKTFDMLETIIDADGNFIYSKMNDNDLRIGNIMVEVKSKKEKEKRNLILLEGKRLIKEALQADCKLEYILFSRMKELQYIRPYLPHIGAKLYKMPYREMQLWSDLTTNPGIMGIFKIPDTESYDLRDPLPLTIICDNMREPNNLGAVLRTSSGVGCEKVLLTKGCASLWDTKVLRTACGGHFKLRLKTKLEWNNIREELNPRANIFLADNNTIISSADTELQKLKDLVDSIPVLPYYGVNFSGSDHIVLIIGGETEGLSEDSYKLASERNGVRLNVPLSNDIDSLNSGTALGVIAFEIKRQLLTKN